MAAPSSDPRPWLVLYDDDCGFCRWSLGVLLRADRERRLLPVALQSERADQLLADLTPEQRMASWHLIAPDGRRRSAGDALPALVALLPRGTLPAAALTRTAPLNNKGYRWVADHRSWFGRRIPDQAKRRADALIAERSTPHIT